MAGKPKRRVRRNETVLERLSREAHERVLIQDRNAPLINKFAASHGDYDQSSKRAPALNRGGTAIDRWKRDGVLSDSQTAAIEYCQRLWARVGGAGNLVMDPLKVIGLPGGSGWSQQEALDELAGFRKRIPNGYWNVYENVCRFDEPAGAAGSRLANDNRSAAVAARLCVCFVADMIAQWKRF